GAVELAVKFQPQTPVVVQARADVVEEEIPFAHAPELIALVAIEANLVGRHEIEPAELRQWNERLHAPDVTIDAEQLDHLVEHRHLVEVEADRVVTEQAGDVEEIAGAAPDIENPFAAANIELQIANPPQILVDPNRHLEVLRRFFARILNTVARAYFLEPALIDRANDFLRVQRYG